MLKKLFGFDSTNTTIRTEVVAGITTFLTMSYILAVNPTMFGELDGMPIGSVFTSTALAAIVGCLAMAFVGKLPFGLAPGMGLNAFFVYSVCMGMGYSWQFALTAVLIEGLIFRPSRHLSVGAEAYSRHPAVSLPGHQGRLRHCRYPLWR